ncbi:MAG: HIRAN domain-containing protein [Sphingobacteriales bacterium]|nr:HIRAN domain-containing protein [Sphingobacteriales bacterium]
MSENNDSTSIIRINPGLLAALSYGQLSIDVFKKEIMVLECMVAGTSFRKLEKVEAELISKVQLEMKREGKNEFDAFAIALYFRDVKVGYIPKDKNEVISRLMDAGKAFYSTIQAREWEGNWLRLDVKVYMKD